MSTSAAALAVAATGLVVVARPTAAALSDVAADCTASAAAYRSDGQRLRYTYSAKKTSTEALSGDKLGWVPPGLVGFGEGGGEDAFESSSLATHPTDGYIYLVKRIGKRIDGVWKITELTTTRVESGFAGTRLLSMAWPYLCRVAGSSLYRYKFAFSNGQPTISSPGGSFGSLGWTAKAYGR